MKVESGLFNFGAPLFLLFGVVYGFVTGWDEWVGTTALFLTTGLALMIGMYLRYTARHIDPRPEDDVDGLIEQGAGEVGVFSPYSWWPLFLAGSAAIIFAGAAIGVWLILCGAALASLAVVGWVFEYYRGEHAH